MYEYIVIIIFAYLTCVQLYIIIRVTVLGENFTSYRKF